MKIFIILSIVLLSLTALVLLYLHVKTLKPVRSLLLHAAIGVGLMIILNLISKFTGFRIPVNIYSIISVCILGAPAVFGFLVLNLII